MARTDRRTAGRKAVNYVMGTLFRLDAGDADGALAAAIEAFHLAARSGNSHTAAGRRAPPIASVRAIVAHVRDL